MLIINEQDTIEMKPINTDRRHCSHSTFCLRRTLKTLPDRNSSNFSTTMKITTGLLLFTVCFGWSNVVEGNPYVTEWWSKGVATVRNLILGPPPAPWHQDTMWNIEFDPEAGPRKSSDYQQQFGPRGDRLVELLGSGGYRPGNNQMFSQSSGPPINTGH